MGQFDSVLRVTVEDRLARIIGEHARIVGIESQGGLEVVLGPIELARVQTA